MEHRFEPAVYHRTFGTHAPVLRVRPGDTIVTTTVDAVGFDGRGEHVTEGSNPLTGPFFVETAEPGDALVVHVDRITPNRPRGITMNSIVASVVDPRDVAKLPVREVVDWLVDVDKHLASFDAGGVLGLIEVPLRPMLGCIGVAPDGGQIISAETAGRYGGNMDYPGIEAGVTMYFPVFAPGALLYVGDGHAVQGQGEIVGAGIDVSMEMAVTVGVRKRCALAWPRGETDEHLLAFGNARPLEQALQHATSELIRWLADDFGIDITAASHLLGQCVEYEIGNVIDPAYTVVCKIAKRHLPAPR
jgi:amidase